MLTINADGSEAEMCGNGIRCAARWLDETGHAGPIAFESGGAIVRAEIVAREPEYLVRVAMGRPRIRPIALPRLDEASFVDLGNPHVVAFVAEVEAVDLASLAARHPRRNRRLPSGTNVHVAATLSGDSMRVRHWERGVGLTMACGTGAVACAAVALRAWRGEIRRSKCACPAAGSSSSGTAAETRILPGRRRASSTRT